MAHVKSRDTNSGNVARSGFQKRLSEAIERCPLNQREIADALDVQKHTVSNWKRGASGMQLDEMLRLPGVLGVNAHWLFTGEGPMDPPRHGVLEMAPERLDQFSEDVRRLVEQLRSEVTPQPSGEDLPPIPPGHPLRPDEIDEDLLDEGDGSSGESTDEGAA